MVKHIATLRPKAQEKAQEAHHTELALYEASARYLAGLKERGIKITPKRWKAEIAELTASKNAKYQRMHAMRDEIKAAERIRKTVEKPTKERQQPQPSKDEMTK